MHHLMPTCLLELHRGLLNHSLASLCIVRNPKIDTYLPSCKAKAYRWLVSIVWCCTIVSGVWVGFHDANSFLYLYPGKFCFIHERLFIVQHQTIDTDHRHAFCPATGQIRINLWVLDYSLSDAVDILCDEFLPMSLKLYPDCMV